MTAPDHKNVAAKLRAPGRPARDAISPLPPPEEIFVEWLLSVPAHDCLEAAARHQVEIIDRSAFAQHPDVMQLRALFIEVASEQGRRKPTANL